MISETIHIHTNSVATLLLSVTYTAILNFLLRVYARYPSSTMGEKSRDMTLMTLRAMANGGMHDHVAQVGNVEVCLFSNLFSVSLK